MIPSDVKCERDLLRLRESAWDGVNHYMLVNHNGSVTITQQRLGEAPDGSVTIARRTFHAMLDWYHREQPLLPDASEEALA